MVENIGALSSSVMPNPVASRTHVDHPRGTVTFGRDDGWRVGDPNLDGDNPSDADDVGYDIPPTHGELSAVRLLRYSYIYRNVLIMKEGQVWVLNW